MPQTLSQIKSLLADHGLRPKHRLGQNFLHDANQLRRIVQAAAISPGDVVLEVGPGTGTLTEALLEAGASVVAVEVDASLELILRRRVLDHHPDRATLLIADVLAGKHALNPRLFDALADRAGDRPFKLVANLPYQVASPLLVALSVRRQVPRMDAAVVMVQREVADRLCAGPGGGAYGPLTVMVQAMCTVQRLFVLPPSCFWPPPKVTSAVVRLVRRPRSLADDPEQLRDLLHRLFTRRRKQLGSILGRTTTLPQGITASMRPEQLTVEQLVTLGRTMSG
jgi:16S rRNA (adenine1518-N6/adenine1519-N6)-dimethyltransferase